MFATSVVQRRLAAALLSKNCRLAAVSSRRFSQLLVPLAQPDQLPQELQSYQLTQEEFQTLERRFADYNNQCSEELKEMNQNRITNIIERGGVEGWETAQDLSSLTKTFEFTSFEQGQHFVQRVGRFCSEHDHHPEWQTSEGGKVVSVRLTSHFAGNKVTLYDFQLAEEMNKAFKITAKEFKMYPYMKDSTFSSLKIFFSTFVILSIGFNFFHYFGDTNPTAAERGQPPQALVYKPIVVPEYQFNIERLVKEGSAEQFAEKEADEYHFKTALFRKRGLF